MTAPPPPVATTNSPPEPMDPTPPFTGRERILKMARGARPGRPLAGGTPELPALAGFAAKVRGFRVAPGGIAPALPGEGGAGERTLHHADFEAGQRAGSNLVPGA